MCEVAEVACPDTGGVGGQGCRRVVIICHKHRLNIPLGYLGKRGKTSVSIVSFVNHKFHDDRFINIFVRTDSGFLIDG